MFTFIAPPHYWQQEKEKGKEMNGKRRERKDKYNRRNSADFIHMLICK